MKKVLFLRKKIVARDFFSYSFNLYLTFSKIKIGADITVTSENGDTLIHEAAFFGTLEIVKYLVNLGLDFNKPNSSGTIPAENAPYEVRKFFGEKGGNVAFFETIEMAVKTGKEEEILWAISKNCVGEHNSIGDLIELCSDENLVKFLLENLPLDFSDDSYQFGNITTRVKNNWKFAWKILSQNQNFLNYAKENGFMINRLWNQNPEAAFDLLPFSENSIQRAIFLMEKPEHVKRFLGMFPERLNSVSFDGTPIFVATINQNYELVKTFLELGADPTTPKNCDAICESLKKQNLKIFKLFLSHFGKEKILENFKTNPILMVYFSGLSALNFELFDFIVQEFLGGIDAKFLSEFQEWDILHATALQCKAPRDLELLLEHIHKNYKCSHWKNIFRGNTILGNILDRIPTNPGYFRGAIFLLKENIFDVNSVADDSFQNTAVQILVSQKYKNGIQWILENTKASGLFLFFILIFPEIFCAEKSLTKFFAFF